MYKMYLAHQGQGRHNRAELLNPGQPGSPSSYRKRPGQNSAPPPTHPVVCPPSRTHFPRFHHLPVVCSAFESINELCHSSVENHQDPIFSGNALTDTPRGVFTALQGISLLKFTVRSDHLRT